ncbi:prepilin peptidase [Bythopirellula goksoeyrii]|nr:A24 family peptidase [Bythopirellula goksoeyrii]
MQLGVFFVGAALGALANWAIYCLAWNPRPISPWGPIPDGVPSRRWSDRLPVLGWNGMRRESTVHGSWFWGRPLLIELSMGIGLVLLCWWEVDQRGLVLGQLQQLLQDAQVPLAFPRTAIPLSAVWPTFWSHAILITLMVAASFIDFDEKIIPDEITVPGTLIGLLLAACLPMSLLPLGTFPQAPPEIGIEVPLPQIAIGLKAYVEPTLLASPNEWSPQFRPAPNWRSLALGQFCWWLWCFALAPRIWRGRRGVWRATSVICRRVLREFCRPPLGVIAWGGALAIAAVWWWGTVAWMGLLTALVGLAMSGAMIWIVRIVGSAAMGREAMGFGDVTLMMMVGTFLGWQACVIVFFVAPFAGLIGGLMQLITKRDDVIPYGPFLCLGALFVMVYWAGVWNRVSFAFQLGWLVPAVLLFCFVMLGILLFIWQQIKRLLFGQATRMD